MGRGTGPKKSVSISKRMYNQKRRGQGQYRGGGGRGRGGSRGGAGGGGGGGGNWNRRLFEDMRGFLCSCNMNEKDCVKEALNLLNEYVQEEDNPVQQAIDETSDEAPPTSSPTEPTGETMKAEGVTSLFS